MIKDAGAVVQLTGTLAASSTNYPTEGLEFKKVKNAFGSANAPQYDAELIPYVIRAKAASTGTAPTGGTTQVDLVTSSAANLQSTPSVLASHALSNAAFTKGQLLGRGYLPKTTKEKYFGPRLIVGTGASSWVVDIEMIVGEE